ncbi:conserved hypothetical protein [Tenacibaculum litoreum]|uniref:Imm8 family immunity protein n=1 Tax=Tenacibaculum litoreum TaxID=321269 RepID=UPI003895AB55
MKAVIKTMHSADLTMLGKSFEEYKPKEKDLFGFNFSLEVGPLNGRGQEVFDFLVASPRYLTEHYHHQSGKKAIFGRHIIIMFEYDFNELYTLVNKYIEKLDEPNWNDLAIKIGRIGHWEFEDYQE